MQITWLGQSGLLFETDDKKILVDPYLSDSVAKTEPRNHRRVAVDERFLKIDPDVIVITHASRRPFGQRNVVLLFNGTKSGDSACAERGLARIKKIRREKKQLRII